ncbi:glycosyltransferase [Alteromonas portus]|uniref:glycosyltransferase n=1 Tax=Alteromonas portus TaxID=2565549 RepID=UPI003BF9286A
MKILKLSTNNRGGATTAAERQAQALRQFGHQVKHLYVRQDWTCKEVTIADDGKDVYLSAPMHQYLKTDLLFQNFLFDNRTDLSNTYMSLWRKSSPFDEMLAEYIRKENFDTVHCHWTSNLISSNLFALLEKDTVQLVMTGHDMNHFTGGCHYNAGCEGFKSNCQSCSQIKTNDSALLSSSLNEKINAYKKVMPKFIFPSDWLNKEYLSSSVAQLLGPNSSQVIRNCIDTDFFSPVSEYERVALRQVMGFSNDEVLIVSGAENNNEIRKGFNYFERAFKTLNTSLYGSTFDKEVTFVAFGGGDHKLTPTHKNVKYRHLGVLTEKQVRDLFRISDLLAFTSIEENFANVILEALMCACPVLGLSIGGIPDIVTSGTNGHLVSELSETEYSTVLTKLVIEGQLAILKEKTKEWRAENFKKYSYPMIAKQLEEFYETLIQGSENGQPV